MTRLYLFAWCAILLFVAGCGAGEGEGAAMLTAAPIITRATRAAEAAAAYTDTPATPLPTATHTLPPPTNTPTATPQPTETLTITPTPLPPPPGEIYFFLDPDPPSNGNSHDQDSPITYAFYRAIPDKEVKDWHVEMIWPETTLAGSFIIVSPDKTNLALLLLEDTNNDGQLNDDPGEDIRNIYVYNRLANSTEQLTNNQYNSFSASWLPNSQAIAYPQRSDILNILMNNPSPENFLTIPERFVWQLSWSPDGQLLIFHTNTQQLYAYHSETGDQELISDSEAALDFVGGVWSPDSYWLAYMQFADYGLELTRRLYVMDKESLTPMLLNADGELVSRPVWSIDSSYLAFTRDETTLSLWNTKTLTFTNILSGQHTSPPVWAPITPQVAVGTVQDDIAQLKTIDVASGNIRTAFESTEIQIIKPYSWSPDGEWILFYAIDDKRSGLYVIHLSSGTFYQIMDTSTGNFPLELVWLPDLEPNSK